MKYSLLKSSRDMNEGFKNCGEGDNEGKMDREPRTLLHACKVVIEARDDDRDRRLGC